MRSQDILAVGRLFAASVRAVGTHCSGSDRGREHPPAPFPSATIFGGVRAALGYFAALLGALVTGWGVSTSAATGISRRDLVSAAWESFGAERHRAASNLGMEPFVRFVSV